jgi:sugar diacid utilization regulator
VSAWSSGFLSFLKWDRYQRFCVFAIQLGKGMPEDAKTGELRCRLRDVANCYTFLFEHDLVMLANFENSELRQSCVAELSDLLPRYGLISGQSKLFDDILEIREYYLQAKDAIRIHQTLGRVEAVNDYNRCMVYDLLQKGQMQSAATRFGDDRLDTLTAYDKRFGTEYYRTLFVYLQQACSRTNTADKLFIHRNTLRYRLEKIGEILDTDIADGEELLKLYISFKQQELGEMPQEAQTQ